MEKNLDEKSYNRAYIRSLFFILYKAVHDLYPQARLHIEHSMPLGFYCDIHYLETELDSDILKSIQKKANEIIAANLPFVHQRLLTQTAIAIYKDNGFEAKVSLFETRTDKYTSVYVLDDTINYFYGPLLDSTGEIIDFHIEKYFTGFLILTPKKFRAIKCHRSACNLIKESENGGSKLFKIFQEHKDWLNILGVPFIGALNQEVLKGRAGQLIKISEALHEKKLGIIADEIHAHKHARIVLISGPSSSGKTTFCKRLGIQLEILSYKPVAISLDDYFVDREFTAKDESGEFDFESVENVDIPFFHQSMLALLAGEEIDYPTFDFPTGKRKFTGKKLKMEERSILVIEGIHALNKKITEKLPNDTLYKIFISALTQIAIDALNPIPSTDNRLLRRIIRDASYRAYKAQDTIERWPSVRKGEDLNIFPDQENADIMFNSALLYEIAVLKKQAEPLLRAVTQDSPARIEADRLLKFLSYFSPINPSEIPPTSLLREFLGGSSFEY